MRAPEPDALRQVLECAGTVSLPPLVLRLLALRGICTPQDMERFLDPKLKELADPFLIPGIRAAAERLLLAADRGESVVLYGDYDVDGVTSLTLLRSILRAYGLMPRTFLPHRMEEGYGISRDGLERLLGEGKPDLLVAVDCGTTSRGETDWLAEQGVETMVLDHHEPNPEKLPRGIVVNPKLGDTWHYLCSAGVVFKLGHAMGKLRRAPDFDLKEHLDLVALATVADIVPLVEENRLLVRKGLGVMEVTRRAGLQALKEISSLSGPVTSMDMGFRLGPRLNASGRLDTAQDSLDLLTTDCHQTAARLARALDSQNRDRQTLEESIQQEALAQARELMEQDPAALIVASRAWHPGVVGIVAARLVKRFHRPVFVIGITEEGLGKGSGRSVQGISLVSGLDDCRELLVAGGGHEMAAGLSIREENIPAFRERFATSIAMQATGDQLEPKVHIDGEMRLSELSLEFLNAYEQLQPFGSGNPIPLFIARGVHATEEPRLLKERHWRFDFIQDGVVRMGVWFNAAHEPLPPPPWDVAFYIDRNTWRGVTRPQLLVQALRPSG